MDTLGPAANLALAPGRQAQINNLCRPPRATRAQVPEGSGGATWRSLHQLRGAADSYPRLAG